ncbi:MAG: TolC family protein [Bacteroidales bacterium]|jgi:outer membrane protein TolC|nr:TolC family protein [Bacteroidales bacterium]
MVKIIKIGILVCLIPLLWLPATSLAQSPKSLSLKMLLDSTLANYPLYKKASLFEQQWQLQMQQIDKQNLPQLELNGKASYQNEVIDIGAAMPAFAGPELSKDQYRFSLDVKQSIYKGNFIRKQKELYGAQKDASLKQLEVEQHEVKAKVVELFFGLQFNDNQQQILRTYRTQLESKITEFEALLRNGSLLQSTMDRLLLEKLKINQQFTEIENDRLKLVKNLSEISGLAMDTATVFILDEPAVSLAKNQQRPQYQLMELNQQQIHIGKKLLDVKYQPILYAFGSAGYGRPGFNMLSDDFDDFYMIGIGLNWKLWDWQQGKQDKQLYELNADIIEVQKETFLKGLQASLNSFEQEMLKLQSLIASDQDIVDIQNRIALTAENQLQNGVITSSQYVEELEKVQQYQLQLVTRKLQLNLSKINYLWALGLL